MAKIGSDIIIKIELRPCVVKDRKALFHKWSDRSRIAGASIILHLIKNEVLEG